MGEDGNKTVNMKKVKDAIAISTAAQGDSLFLINSNHPGMTLTTIPFDGSNFLAWSRQVKLALRAKMKLGFLDGCCMRSEDDLVDGSRWDRCNSMVACWLLNSITSELSSSFIYTDSASDLWLEICDRYSQSSGPLIYHLGQELSLVSQRNLTVTAYYSKLKKCCDELSSLCGMPSCKCGAISKCVCGVLTKVAEMENESRRMKFLLKLNPEYDSVKSQILSIDPLPNVGYAFCIVLQVEKICIVLQVEKKKQLSNQIVEPVAFMANRGENENSEKWQERLDRQERKRK